MINKDYLLRIAEKFGRALAIILHLRQFNRYEEALIAVDDLLLQNTGLTSSFINSISDEILMQVISPLGMLNVEKCLWIAVLLKAEGEIYEDQGKTSDSYYRYLKSLHLFLLTLAHETVAPDNNIFKTIQELLNKLAEYELPQLTKEKLFPYYERTGQYDKAEDILFEILENTTANSAFFEQGRAFYTRLSAKSDAELQQGNLDREEVAEGLALLNTQAH